LSGALLFSCSFFISNSASQQMDFSMSCLDYVDFRWPEGVEVFAAAHPFDDISEEELSSYPDSRAIETVSKPAVACIIPTAPVQLVLTLEFGRSYLYETSYFILFFMQRLAHRTHQFYHFPQLYPRSLSVDPKFVHPSAPDTPAETPFAEFLSGTAPGLRLLPQVGIFTSHAVPFSSGPGQVPGIRCYKDWMIGFLLKFCQVGPSTQATDLIIGVRFVSDHRFYLQSQLCYRGPSFLVVCRSCFLCSVQSVL
jgi:hypothetical protein